MQTRSRTALPPPGSLPFQRIIMSLLLSWYDDEPEVLGYSANAHGKVFHTVGQVFGGNLSTSAFDIPGARRVSLAFPIIDDQSSRSFGNKLGFAPCLFFSQFG